MGSTEDFLRILNESNARIAAMQTEAVIPPDEHRLKKEAERREKWGQLRAREHPSKRPPQVRSVFGYIRPGE